MPVNVLPVLAASRQTAEANANVLDHISSTRLRSSASTTPPISKQILSTLFSAVSESRTHVFVENEQDTHFLYGLVLPLVARVLAVSTPGLLVVVQLPRPDVVPEWAVPTYDGYGSNGSGSVSKSAAPTTPSPQDTSRTPSPSDDVPRNERKSLSPDAHPGTEELIRRADKVLSTAEAAKIAAREDGSPPPDSVVQDHAALRLICNGFEVLTGKMPPPRCDMGAFTLASVAWEKAGVLEPEDPAKGVSMSFSNGMVTPTEGIVVTFSNGSLCLLTTRDPLAGLDSLKVSEATPVVVFPFVPVGYASVSELLAMKPESLEPVAAKVRENLEKPNFFFLEIGHTGSLPNGITANPRGEKKDGEKSSSQVKNDTAVPSCPPILVSSVPRAVPLFVNTIYQAFIDHPYYEHTEKYGSEAPSAQSPETEGPETESPETEAPPVTTDQPETAPAPSSCVAKPADKSQAPETTVEEKNETDEGHHVSKTAAEPNVFPTSAPQPAKPLPPVREVVRLSQGVPEGPPRHHAPMYNYPYPGHIYTSNPQNHHVMPSHHPLPPMQRQSVGNPYYMGGHTPTAAHPPYPPSGYPPNGYYPQHVVPGHDSWRRVPQYPDMGHPGHPMDARRDMPAQFAHRADQYAASYYTPMNEMYPSQHVGVPPSQSAPMAHSQSVVQNGVAGPPTMPNNQSMPVTKSISGNANHNGKRVNGVLDATREKENALEALMHMRSKGASDNGDAKREAAGAGGPNGSKDVSPARRNGHIRSTLGRNQRSDTVSSTSTNSGGGALVHGAIVGHSHGGMLPHQKRRKR